MTVHGITRDQFNLWKHDPVSKLLWAFLTDKKAFLTASATEQWLSGSSAFTDINQAVRGQIIELGELIDIPFEIIEAFYQETENAAENPVSQEV